MAHQLVRCKIIEGVRLRWWHLSKTISTRYEDHWIPGEWLYIGSTEKGKYIVEDSDGRYIQVDDVEIIPKKLTKGCRVLVPDSDLLDTHENFARTWFFDGMYGKLYVCKGIDKKTEEEVLEMFHDVTYLYD